MSDAVISIVVERVAALIEDQIRYQVNLVRGAEKEVLDLSDKLETIKDVLDDAEKRGAKEQGVKSWLKKLEDVAYQMDDVLDEWNYVLLKHKMRNPPHRKGKVCCSFIPSPCLCLQKLAVRRDTAIKILNVKSRLGEILKEKEDFNFVPSLPANFPVPKSPRDQSTSSIELGKIHGVEIDRNKNDIVKKLMVTGDSKILSIVGMGGIGKTTLAQLVYNDTRVKDCFELKIWICVSDPFDVDGIARGIVNGVGRETIPQGTNQLELVLQKLKTSVRGKKFLLVLDDVWTEDYNKWEPLKVNLNDGAEGSKILVTTRNERVAKMMGTSDSNIYRPQHLSDEECWSLLRRISLPGRSEEECREYEDVGMKIAGKCKGLPLAANVLGSLLQFKKSVREWEYVRKSEVWRLEKAEVDLFPHLLLSYNELTPALKRCFSYCAVYPKDYRINSESLIEEWIALGYLGSASGNGGVEVEVEGRGYFDNLAMRSFFQDFERSDAGDEEIEWCKMHDIVHDFALFLRKNDGRLHEGAAEMTKRNCQACDPLLISRAQEYRTIFLGEELPTNHCDCLTSLRVLRFVKRGNSIPLGMEKLIHLRLLDLSSIAVSKEVLEIICKLYFLQTLKLSWCDFEEIPPEIENLVHLRHLDLSHNSRLKDLPESICNLVELQILNVRCCYSLKELPKGIHRLRNLEHLLTRMNPGTFSFPQEVAQLSGLRTLDIYHRGRDFNKLGLLKNLNCLTRTLDLEVYYSRSTDLKELAEDAREAELRNKTDLQNLTIFFTDNEEEWPWPPSSSPLWMDIIDALEPHQNLKGHIAMYGCRSSRLPHWISSPLLLVKEIFVEQFHAVPSLPALGKLPFLEVLRLAFWNHLKVVGREFLGLQSSSSSASTNDVVAAFPKLKQLSIDRCPEWAEWEDITAEEEESATISIMPRLTEMNVTSCGSLKKLPHRLLRKASSSLRILNITYSSVLEDLHGDKDGSVWRFISQNNPELELIY